MFWDIFSACMSGCLRILNLSIPIGGFNLSLAMVLCGSVVISLVGKFIWGLFE